MSRVETTLKNEIVDVTVNLYRPYQEFMTSYLKFFGSDLTVELLARRFVYDGVKALFAQLVEFADKNGLGDAWFRKWPNLTIISGDEPEQESEEK